jgi:hypothetical protein
MSRSFDREQLGQDVGVQHRVGGQVERAAGVADQGHPTSLSMA